MSHHIQQAVRGRSVRGLPMQRVPVLVLALAALALTGCTGGGPAASSPEERERPVALAEVEDPPNVVLFLTDDQVKGTLDAMSTVRREIVQQGMLMENAIIPTSTCCPSRVALLTGQQAHTNGVYANVGPAGGWKLFAANGAEQRTVAVALRDAGYQTGYFGKYLNGWVASPEDYVPPGWDEFMAIRDPSSSEELGANAYYNYWLTGTQAPQWHGDSAEDYSTDVLATLATEFVQSADPDRPLFLIYSTTGPHAPFTPAPRHEGARSLPGLPEWFSNDVAGKPPWLEDYEPASPMKTRRNLRDQQETLMSVDEGIARIMEALGDRESNTLFVFMSDNGLQLGSHRLTKKYVPYVRTTEVPMAVRYDGVIEPGTVLTSVVTNVDITATIADVAGARMDDLDGASILSRTNDEAVLEGIAREGRPAYCGVRTEDFLYVYHDRGQFEELYDYRNDPWERRNVVDDPEYVDVASDLREAAVERCLPTPPGFRWK